MNSSYRHAESCFSRIKICFRILVSSLFKGCLTILLCCINSQVRETEVEVIPKRIETHLLSVSGAEAFQLRPTTTPSAQNDFTPDTGAFHGIFQLMIVSVLIYILHPTYYQPFNIIFIFFFLCSVKVLLRGSKYLVSSSFDSNLQE